MKKLTALLGILIFAGNTWASCMGGKSAVICQQISPGENKLAAFSNYGLDRHGESIVSDITLADMGASEHSFYDPTKAVDHLKCVIGDFVAPHDGNQVCTSEKYSYRVIGAEEVPKSNDPYIVRAQKLVATWSGTVAEYGLIVQNLQTRERAVLRCQRIVDCPSH